jgi:hypothetical protein
MLTSRTLAIVVQSIQPPFSGGPLRPRRLLAIQDAPCREATPTPRPGHNPCRQHFGCETVAATGWTCFLANKVQFDDEQGVKVASCTSRW